MEWMECGSKEEWRVKMLNPNEWGDQIVLHLASNLLKLEIQIIPAFRESASDPGTRNLEAGHVRTHRPILLEAVVGFEAKAEVRFMVGEVFLMSRVHVMKL